MRKKTAKEVVTEVVAKVNEELAAPKIEEPKADHYYRCNVTLANDKPCNCSAFN